MKRVVAAVIGTLLVSGVAWSKKPKPEPAAEPAPVAAPAPEAAAVDLGATVKYRGALMSGLGKHMGMSKMILDGKVAGDLSVHASALHGLAGEMKVLFPAGTGKDAFETHALPTIWERPDDFTAAWTAYDTATAAFAAAAPNGDLEASKAAFGEVGKACGGCHDTFREEDDH